MNRATCVQRILSDGPTNCAARLLSSLSLQRLVVAASPVLVHRNVGVRAERGTDHGIIRWTSAGRPSHERRSTSGFQGSLPRTARRLASPSRTGSGRPVPRRPVLRRPRSDPGPLRDGPASSNRRALGAAGGPFLRRQPPVPVPVDPDISRPRPTGTAPTQARAQSRPQVYRRGAGLCSCSPIAGFIADARRDAHRDSGTPGHPPSSPHTGTATRGAGKKTSPIEPAVGSTVPSSLDLTARYERLRERVLLQRAPDSHEVALVVHRGIPGWLDFARRLSEDGSPPDRARADAPAHPERTSPDTLSSHRELVAVLASVVRHCLEVNP